MKKNVLSKLIVFALAFCLIFTSGAQMCYAKTSISNTSISLKVGMGKKLKVNGAGWSDPVWSSANKSIAKVSKSGTVIALKKGTTTITAKLGKKKYKCKVKVTGTNAFTTKPSHYSDYDYWGDLIISPTKIWYGSDGKVKVKLKIKNDTSRTQTFYIYDLDLSLTAQLKNGSSKWIADGTVYKKGLKVKLGPNKSVYKTVSIARKGGVDFKKVKMVDYDYEYYDEPDYY